MKNIHHLILGAAALVCLIPLNIQASELLDAATIGNTDAVRRLIKEGADINAKDWDGLTPLDYAAETGNTEIVLHLINNGANVEGGSSRIFGYHTTTLHLAPDMGHTEIALLLINRGADVNAKGYLDITSLHQF